MHDGGIGGGKAGVGKEAFLTWSKITLEEALRSDGQLAADLEHGLDALGITVQRFDVSGEKSPRVTLL